MGAYHQMGHHSENLLVEVSGFAGAVLSPVNYPEPRVTEQVKAHHKETFEMIFDPQLYYPNSQRGSLASWSYFPSDVDTADGSSLQWWNNVNAGLARCIQGLKPVAVCSPAIVPRVFTHDYYDLNVQICDDLMEHHLGNSADTPVLQTLIVDMNALSQPEEYARIATIASRAACNRVYLIVHSDIAPRLEMTDVQGLTGVINLIHSLESAGVKVLVSHASTDVVLWKCAGATSCATGKFFNLRRFTPSRWFEPQQGGGQLPYWTENSLLAYLREGDLIRLNNAHLIPASSSGSPEAQAILSNLANGSASAWLALGWKQYLSWFAAFETSCPVGARAGDALLSQTEANWDAVEKARILMEERRNDGSWIRSWRIALNQSNP